MGKHYGLDIPTLHELRIDVDKEWVDEDAQPRGIFNIKEIDKAMATGHMAQSNSIKLLKVPPSVEGYVLTSQGPGKLVVWAPGGSYFLRFFPVTIDLSHAEAIVTINHSHSINSPITSEHKQTYGDAPADYIKRLTPAVSLVDTEAIVTVDKSHNKNAPITREAGLQMLVDGAVADDGGVQTDETSEARDAVENDMTLLPVCTNGGLAVNDAYYFGFNYKFARLWLNVGTAGVGNYALAHEYWDGDSWELLPDVVDETSEFTIAGLNKMEWTVPGDWAQTTVQGMNLYWIRARVTNVVTYTQQPLGTQAWCEVLI